MKEVNKSVFIFNGETYKVKGKLCCAIVRHYVENNPNVTLAMLQRVFNVGQQEKILLTLDEAMQTPDWEGKMGKNYYVKQEDQIALKEGPVVVWNYWPVKFFEPFMQIAKDLGYEVVEQNVVNEANLQEKGTEPSGEKLAKDGKESEKKTYKVVVGPGECYMLEVYDCNSKGELFDMAAEVRDEAIEEGDGEWLISDLIYDGLNMDPTFVWFMKELENGTFTMRVLDENGKTVYESDDKEVSDCFLGDPRKMVFSDKYDAALVEEFRQNVASELSDLDEDCALPDEDWVKDTLWDFRFGFVENYISFCLRKSVGHLCAAKQTRLENFSYECSIELDADEEFDPEKLCFFSLDYDDICVKDDCVTPVMQYGNKIYEMEAVDDDWDMGDETYMMGIVSKLSSDQHVIDWDEY